MLPHLDIFGVDISVGGEGKALNFSLVGCVKLPQMNPFWIRITEMYSKWKQLVQIQKSSLDRNELEADVLRTYKTTNEQQTTKGTTVNNNIEGR